MCTGNGQNGMEIHSILPLKGNLACREKWHVTPALGTAQFMQDTVWLRGPMYRNVTPIERSPVSRRRPLLSYILVLHGSCIYAYFYDQALKTRLWLLFWTLYDQFSSFLTSLPMFLGFKSDFFFKMSKCMPKYVMIVIKRIILKHKWLKIRVNIPLFYVCFLSGVKM